MDTWIWQALVGRAEGPLAFRLILQPAVAIILAIQAGLQDARQGRAPFLFTIFSDPNQRNYLLHQGWKSIWKIFTLAVIMDLLYQWLVLNELHPLRACMIAGLLAVVPYAVVRGIITRLSRYSKSRT